MYHASVWAAWVSGCKERQHTWTIDEEHTRQIIRKAWNPGSIFTTLPSDTRAAQASSIWEGALRGLRKAG